MNTGDIVRVERAPQDDEYAKHLGEIGVVSEITQAAPQLAVVEFPLSSDAQAYHMDELKMVPRG